MSTNQIPYRHQIIEAIFISTCADAIRSGVHDLVAAGWRALGLI